MLTFGVVTFVMLNVCNWHDKSTPFWWAAHLLKLLNAQNSATRLVLPTPRSAWSRSLLCFTQITSSLISRELSANSCYSALTLKEKSKVFKYAKWPSKWLTNESLVWDLIFFLNERIYLYWFLIDFIFCRLAETAVLGSPSVTWLSWKWCQSGESVRLPS